MRKILLSIKENWKDPVWSKIIATAIISIAGFILTTLYAFLKLIFSKISFADTFANIWDLLNHSLTLKIWIVIILSIIYLILILKPISKLVKDVIVKINSQKETEEIEDITEKLPRANEYSTSLFSQRMASAFPGIRQVTWFNNSKTALHRLEILLKTPLNFRDGTSEYESDPIWWFRGVSASHIRKFQKSSRNKALMNMEQLKIKRIAAIRGNSYYKDFVYVETEGEKQTGLYKHSATDIQRHIETFGYSSEEYGIIKNKLGWKIPIRREDYDDGATVLKGKVKDEINAELRVRYLSNYNFIIAAKGSPYNSTKFCQLSEEYLNGLLKNEVTPDEFFEFLRGFKKYER